MRKGLSLSVASIGGVAVLAFFLTTGGAARLEELSSKAQSAATFFVQSISVAKIKNEYREVRVTESAPAPAPTKKVRILIVPGHQPDAGGTEFDGLRERMVVMDIADALAGLIAQNPHYEVMVSRTKDAWHPVLQSYFDTHELEIETFRQSQAVQMATYIADGRFVLEDEQVYHNAAPSEAAYQLYGLNKWASDNEYGIILHLHLNDYARRRASVAGEYDGFAVYVPNRQYSNAAAARPLGEAIARRLNAFHATSTLPQESAGVVEDRELIAVGSNNSVDGAALLIEYGYIYESQFQEPSVRPLAVADYAFQTYLGLQDFFEDPLSPTYGSISFPYDWTEVSGKKNERGPAVYALQAALHYLGYYPPKGKSFSECPVTGVVRNCTRSALMAYQRAHGLEETGTLGPRTRAALTRDLARSLVSLERLK